MKNLVVNFLALLLVDQLFSFIMIDSYVTMLVMALVLTILNATVKPILKFLCFPVTFLTFGLFSLIINAGVLQLTFMFVDGAYAASFGGLIIAGIVVSLANSVLCGK
ncbi:MAG: phage holin family protein [Erysipelotrichaceae bacterium]|nr:phage holin family protein [Erysipelotrichaceae bacterium]MDY5251785.1 phage holin family protein [Erysipelotrichaceae bacterium]